MCDIDLQLCKTRRKGGRGKRKEEKRKEKKRKEKKMTTYHCKYCDNHSFDCKLNYERHMLICMFKHKSNAQKQKELETIEPKLTESERDKLIRSMFYKIQKLMLPLKN